jgi:UDP-4-amino-4,6-dideoxy-N-acetyl-beta-L-altrosamine transaminase
MIPYSRQKIFKEDIKEVVRVLNSDFLTKGKKTLEFEKNLRKKVNVKFAISCNSGSSALLLACRALSLKKNDIVWTVPNTYAASANCAIECGAKVDFVDINPKTWNISVNQLEKKLKISKLKNKLPKILVLVHLAGMPCQLEKIYRLSKKYKFKIIEDASHAIGASYKNSPIGSCKWSDLTVFSFHPVKIITSAEGGAITTNNKKLSDKIKLLRENGIHSIKSKFKNLPYYPNYYEQVDSGFNFRMSEISAALVNSQLKKLNFFVNKRNQIAKTYLKLIKNPKFIFQDNNKDAKSSYHLFVVKLTNQNSNQYLKIFKIFNKNKIFINLHYNALHLNPFFEEMGFKKGQFPISENYSYTAFSIPIFVGLEEKNIKKIISILNNF